MVSSDDVTITETGDGWLEVAEVGHEGAALRPAEVAALRAHFVAERMPEDVQTLVDEARENVESAARGVPDSQAARLRAGIADDPRLALIVRLTRALEAAYSQKAEPEWEYGVRDYRSPGDGVWVVGPTWGASLREYYWERPLVRRRKAGEWEPVEDEVANGGE